MSKRKVVLLGSTGSIGTQALDVIRQRPEMFEVVGLSAGSDREALEAQAKEFGVENLALGADDSAELASLAEADVVLNAVTGSAGLKASLETLRAGKVLALANKESLVAGGDLCLGAAEEGGGQIVAVDSEHAALAQCLEGRGPETISRVVITASGGPFRERLDLTGVTREEALAHPTWSMGPKITIDSATLMNKGLEIIEAHFLFGFDYDRIGVLVHPQSAVHALVELTDGSSVMQLAPADMRIPILAALAHPERPSADLSSPIDLAGLGSLDFEPLDHERFPAARMAVSAGRAGGSTPAALNAANEVAVHAFLDGNIEFVQIMQVVEKVLDEHEPVPVEELEDVIEVDVRAREQARAAIGSR